MKEGDVGTFYSEAAALEAKSSAQVETDAGYLEINRFLRRAECVLRPVTKGQRLGEGLTREQARTRDAWVLVQAAQRVVRRVRKAQRLDQHFTVASLTAPTKGGES